MNMSKKFEDVILPKLLEIAKTTNSTEGILSISLYGSAHYSSYGNAIHSSLSIESDYDIWIIFKTGFEDKAKQFASLLFKKNFSTVQEKNAFILYDKLHLEINRESFLLAPIITTENIYQSLDTKMGSSEILIPWYRSNKRGRDPVVPIRSVQSEWTYFDMQQTYLADLDLWKLLMPLAIPLKKGIALGTFIEGSLTGKFFYGDANKYNYLMKKIARWFVSISNIEDGQIANVLYEMMTVSQKANSTFKDVKIQEINYWLSP